MSLDRMGWSAFFAQAFSSLHTPGEPARVTAVHRGKYIVAAACGDFETQLSGRFLYDALNPADWPAVGDWVIVHHGGRRIEALLPRRTCISRKHAGKSQDEQVLAANVDTLLIVTGLDSDFNPRRIERYLLLAAESGAAPIVLLNKMDLHPPRDLAFGAPVIALSAQTGQGVDQLAAYLTPGSTAALIGSSGAGKSTLINRLLGRNIQSTQPVREGDERGRHTTTARQLFIAPAGWLLIDMPGLREIQPLTGDGAFDTAFSDIAELADACRFRDCRHQGEPGCAVAESIDAARLANYAKLQREMAYLDRKEDRQAELEHKQKWKQIHKAAKEIYKRRTKL